MRPLLLANTEVYDGPWTPTGNLDGIIRAEGLIAGQDEVVIMIRDLEEEEPDSILVLQMDAEIDIGEITKSLIQARRTASSGSEVHIWVS